MSRRFLAIAAGVFLLISVAGPGAAVLNAGAVQDSSKERVTNGKRIIYPSFQLEVLVNGRPLPEYHSRGRTYVEALRGAEYELRLRNSSADRVAVALSVDGLNTIDARQTSAWNASKWVIEPYQTITISGWQMSTERARRFYFTTKRDSYAAKLGQKANLGVISAVVFRERRRAIPVTPGQPRSSASAKSRAEAAEGRERSESGRMSDDRAVAPTLNEEYAATGIGRSVRNDVRWVDMELDSRPVAEVTLRYEYSRGRFCPEP